jgi:hypothetical protein
MPPQGHPQLIEIYEDRVARLEEGVTECKVGLGIVNQQITDGVKMLSEKLDAVAMLSERVAVLETQERIRKETTAAIEAVHEARRARRSLTWKAVAGAVTAIVAIVMTVSTSGGHSERVAVTLSPAGIGLRGSF